MKMLRYVAAANAVALSNSGITLERILAAVSAGEELAKAAAKAADEVNWEVRDAGETLVVEDETYFAGCEVRRDLSQVCFFTCGGHGVRFTAKADGGVDIDPDAAPSVGFWADALVAEDAVEWRRLIIEAVAAGEDPAVFRRRELPAEIMRRAVATSRAEAAENCGAKAALWTWYSTPAEHRDEHVADRAARKGREVAECAASILGITAETGVHNG